MRYYLKLERLLRRLFSQIRDISENEMDSINFMAHKTIVVYELADGVFYEKRSNCKFFVHMMDDENENFHALLSCKV